jgi:hypothetical protein
MTNLKRTKHLTMEALRDTYGDLFIMEHYLGELSLKKNYVNPIRANDRTPSGRFYLNGDILNYNDFADSDYSFDVFTYVMKTFNLSFTEALTKIADDLKYDDDTKYIPRLKQNLLSSSKEVSVKSKEFKIKERTFNKFDLNYWNKFNISEQTLNVFNVSAVNTYHTIDLKTEVTSKSYIDLHYDPCYVYHFNHKSDVYNKLYRPLTAVKAVKWRSNCNSKVLQGFEQLQYKSNILFITSSLKDVMTLYSLGYEAVAPQSENVKLDKALMDDLLFAYSHIVVFYDNDNAGKKGATKIIEEFKSKKIRKIFTSSTYKDVSDYMNAYGTSLTEELIIEQLNKVKIKKIKLCLK